MTKEQEVILHLLKFQYAHKGYGHLVCISCGALAVEDDGIMISAGECSRSCPWKIAAELVEGLDE